MPIPEKDKLDKIEELKSKLFSRNYEGRVPEHDHFTIESHTNVPDRWQSEDTGPATTGKSLNKTSMFKKFFIFALIFFLLAIGYAAYTFFWRGNTVSNENIEISILGNTFTAGGEDLPLQVEVANKNTSALELVDLVVEYPKGTSGDTAGDIARSRVPLGTIPAGAVKSENFKIVLFGEQGSTSTIKVSIEYRVSGSNAIFVKEKSYQVNINSTPINLLMDVPAVVSPNQEVSIQVTAGLNANKPASKILLKIEYPVGFSFTSANPAPSFGNNVWNLGDLSPGSEHKISIIGKMLDVSDGEEKTFHVYTGPQSTADKHAIGVALNSASAKVLIKRASIEANLSINGQYGKEYAVDSKTRIVGQINWSNNLDTKINDMVIRAKLSGTALDRRTVSSQDGFYNSASDIIIWDKNSTGDFSEIAPGSSGSVGFSLGTLPIFSASGGILPNPAVNIEISISGRQAIAGGPAQDLANSESKIIRIISDVGFANKVLYYSGAFKNTGPIPPKVEKETTYTVIWTLSNTSNPISKTVVRATLPPWVRFINNVSPKTENLTYNATTKEITWNVGNLTRGASLTGPGREVSFQIGFIPSLSQVGSTPVLINDAVLTGHDDFAKVDVRVNKTSLNTRLSNDPDFLQSGARVVE